MLRFVRCFLQYFSITSVHSSSSSLAQDGVHLRLWYQSPMVTWHNIPITFSPFPIFFIILLFQLQFLVYNPTLAGLYPFLLGSPARCTFLSYLCLYICLGSPAISWPSRSAVALTTPLSPPQQLKSHITHQSPLTGGDFYNDIGPCWTVYDDVGMQQWCRTLYNDICSLGQVKQCMYNDILLSSEFGQRCRVWSHAKHWLQLVGCAALLLDASNFGGPDGVGESGIEPRRSLRRREQVKEK